MVCAEAALTPASRIDDARTSEVRCIILPSYRNTFYFLCQIFVWRWNEINAPTPHLTIKQREAAIGSLSENAMTRSVARTAPATIRAAGSDIAGPAVRAWALARHLFDDRCGVLHESAYARSGRRL